MGNESKTTGDGRYLLPDGFDAVSNLGCALSFASSTAFKSSDYTSQLEVSVKATAKYLPAAFEGSSDYKNFYQRTTSSKQRQVSSVARCAAYTAFVNAHKRAAF